MISLCHSDLYVFLYIYPKEVSENDLTSLCENLKKDTSRGIKFKFKFNSLYLFTYDAIGGKITITENSEVVKQIKIDFPKFTFFIDNSGSKGVELSLFA